MAGGEYITIWMSTNRKIADLSNYRNYPPSTQVAKPPSSIRLAIGPPDGNWTVEIKPSTTGEIPLSKYCPCTIILMPVYWYMQMTGLINVFCRKRFRRLALIYNVGILLLLSAATIRIGTYITIPNDGLSFAITVEFIAPLYFLNGIVSALLLFRAQYHLMSIRAAIAKELSAPGDKLYRDAYLRRLVYILTIVLFILPLINAIAIVCIRTDLIDVALPSITNGQFPYYLFDVYATFINQSAILAVPTLYTIFCVAIRFSAEKLCADLSNSKANVGDLQWIRKRYEAIHEAINLMQQYFSLAALAIYAIGIPMMCFILYSLIRGASSGNALTVITMLLWVCDMFGVILLYSIPAFLLHEKGEELLSSVMKMFYNNYEQTNDIIVYSQLHFFAFEIQSRPLTLSAGGFFSLSRSMLLTLFSAVITYLFILIEFDDRHSLNTASCPIDLLIKNATG